jgi:hypothetical protein
MSPLAVKTYMMLLHEAYFCSTRPYLPDDEEELWLMAYCESREEWESIKEDVLGMFDKKVVDGVNVLANKRLERDWEHLQEIRDVRAEAGRKGGLAKAKQMPSSTKQNVASKEVSKGREVSEEEKDTDMKLKDELTKIAAQHGAKAGGYKTTWDGIKSLGVAHGTGAVATDFSGFMEEYHGDDFPAGAVVSYLRVAAERLTASTAPAAVASKDPRVIGLIRELTYLSGDKVTFQGRHKVALADLLAEYSPEELIGVFQTFVQDKDLEDSYILKFITQNFLDAADGLAYSARKRKQEIEANQAARDAAVRRLQDQAETERLQREAQKDQETFDPFSETSPQNGQTVV